MAGKRQRADVREQGGRIVSLVGPGIGFRRAFIRAPTRKRHPT